MILHIDPVHQALMLAINLDVLYDLILLVVFSGIFALTMTEPNNSK